MVLRLWRKPALGEPISIVSASDDNYAMPLAVTVRSVIDHLPATQPLDVYILDGGLTEVSKERLARSWSRRHVKIEWLNPPIEKIADLKTENHLNLVTYLRLFMPILLPQELDRVLFLDADMLIEKDVTELWRTELGDAPIAAVHDYFTPYLNTRETIGRPSICDRHPDKSHPVPNYRELGLNGTAPYFNAGVMVVNLKKWREIDVLHKATQLVRENWEHVRYCDQYALNVLFSEQWKQLDPRWNQNSNLWVWRGPDESAFGADKYWQLRNEPWIVHFTWLTKPWHYNCTHPYTRKFFKVVDRTAWRGWRPPAPPRTMSERVTDYYKQYRAWYRRSVAPYTRTLKETIRGRRAA